MRISLIVPIYNERPFLERCLLSIIKQTVPFDEVILIDDGSTDGSADIVERQQWARRLLSVENNGVAHSRNIGIEEATGDYVAFLDSDDELKESACETMHKAIEEFKKAEIIQFDHIRIKKDTQQGIYRHNPRKWYDLENGVENLPDYWCMVYNKLYERESISVRFREGLQFGEDEIFNLLLLLQGKRIINYPQATTIKHFENEESICHKLNLDLLKKQDEALRELLSLWATPSADWFKIKAIVDLIDGHHNSRLYAKFGWRGK